MRDPVENTVGKKEERRRGITRNHAEEPKQMRTLQVLTTALHAKGSSVEDVDVEGSTEYERRRDARIALNNAYLESLGVASLVTNLRTPVHCSTPTPSHPVEEATNEGGTALPNQSKSTTTKHGNERRLVQPWTIGYIKLLFLPLVLLDVHK